MNTIYGKILWRTSLPVLLLLFLAVSCKQSEQHSSWEKKYDSFYRSVTDSLTTHPQQIRALAKQKMEMSTDSLEWYYYSAIVLKTYMFTSDVDSARYLIKRIEDFCAREQSSPYLADLRSEYLNTKGNIYVRVGAMDSAIVCFTDSYKQRLQGMKTESVPDILINLADACSRQGKYDVSAFWYRKALQIGDSLGISEGRRHPVYYGLAQVYMALHDFDQCDYYYNLAGMFYDKMLPYEKYIYLNNRGNSYYYREDYPEALKYFKKGFSLAVSHPDMGFEKNLCMVNLGDVYLQMNEPDSAAKYINECQPFFRKIGQQERFFWIGVCVLVLVIACFIYLYEKKRRALLLAQSQRTISSLRLENIRNRMSPHFIFNVLNQEMGSREGENKKELSSLVKLMRRNLELAEQMCVTLKEELGFVQTYIDLQRRSLGPEFKVTIEVGEDVDTNQLLLPSMLIQIPVENAIKHALRGKEGERRLWIDVHRSGTYICVRITDNGGGFKLNSANRGTGTGMKVIMQTIQILNAKNKEMIETSVHNIPLPDGETGCEVSFHLPLNYDYSV